MSSGPCLLNAFAANGVQFSKLTFARQRTISCAPPSMKFKTIEKQKYRIKNSFCTPISLSELVCVRPQEVSFRHNHSQVHALRATYKENEVGKNSDLEEKQNNSNSDVEDKEDDNEEDEDKEDDDDDDDLGAEYRSGDFVGGLMDSEDMMGEDEFFNSELGIPDRVVLDLGISQMPRVTLLHESGSSAEVYLFGANVTSWRLPDASEVLYLRQDKNISYDEPISGGIPICFPQFGEGGDSPGALPRHPAMQRHGFARNCEWELTATGADLGFGGTDVGVMLRLTDNDYTRAMWDFPFELTYEVLLSASRLVCRISVTNLSQDKAAPFTAALHPYLGVLDASDPDVSVVGLGDTQYFDKAPLDQGGKLRVRTLESDHVKFDGGLVDSVFVDTPEKVGLNVGTGASIVISNSEGFSDHIVWNPGKTMDYGFWKQFVCVESGRVARPVKLAPQKTWEGQMALELWDEPCIAVENDELYGSMFDNPDDIEEEQF
mmetsp:Transcript_17855/g.24704  ORF Transcript_17855/g.24704 Transcript_17855/m.24704 type:complete len:490 (+) Transcript_17855:64-1533(+)